MALEEGTRERLANAFAENLREAGLLVGVFGLLEGFGKEHSVWWFVVVTVMSGFFLGGGFWYDAAFVKPRSP